MKGKVRSFVNEYKKEIALGASSIVGFIVGCKICGYTMNAAYKSYLEKMLLAEPELYPLMIKAIKEINHK